MTGRRYRRDGDVDAWVLEGIEIRPPLRSALTDGVYETLKQLIMDRRIGPGERLNIDELARRLDVSPTPVREALARLESEKLVSKRAHAGYRVAPTLDTSALVHLNELRELLESYCAKRAASLATGEALGRLQELLAAMEESARGTSYPEYRTFLVRDAEFHRVIAQSCGNALIAETLGSLRAHWQIYRLEFTPTIAAETIEEHRAILEALTARDPEASARAMTTHLGGVTRRLQAAADGS